MEEKKPFNKVEYDNKFIASNYDRINLTVPKGERNKIQAHANTMKESTNKFIYRAIIETMERDKNGK